MKIIGWRVIEHPPLHYKINENQYYSSGFNEDQCEPTRIYERIYIWESMTTNENQFELMRIWSSGESNTAAFRRLALWSEPRLCRRDQTINENKWKSIGINENSITKINENQWVASNRTSPLYTIKSMKINTTHQDSTKINVSQQESMKTYENQWQPMKINKN